MCAWAKPEFGAVVESGMKERPEGGSDSGGASVEMERLAAVRLWSCAADRC